MKKLLLLATVIIGSVLLWNYAKPEKVIQTVKQTVQNSVRNIIPQENTREYVFIPYWSFTKNIVTDSEYSLIYFGVGVDGNGLDKADQGYLKLSQFVKLTPNASERILAIRMTDKIINADVLKDISLQEKIASQAVSLALENGFDGVLLDYETSAFGFDSTTNNISSFYKLFSDKTHEAGKLFYVSVYGDTYFRARPFDLKKIGQVSDKVLIMTYDFSKSRGNPGPNFPYKDNGTYGYDLEKMINDFQKDVDNKKIVVIFGYFGYDWKTDVNGESVASGVPLSTLEIQKEFLKECNYKNCIAHRDPESLEPSVRYTDDKGDNHVVWFEDLQSVGKKKELLKSKGILETSSWAYSYF